MLLLGVLLLAHAAFAIRPKPLSSLEQRDYPTPSPSSGGAVTSAPQQDDDDDDGCVLANGFPCLSPKTKAMIEQCIIDDYINEELSCGNNPYAGLTRLSFHDCGTYDSTNASYPAGCHAWMSYICDELDECEFMAHENNGLQPWVLTLNDMYANARINGKPLSQLISKADAFHLSAHRALMLASSNQLNLSYSSGRVDPVMTAPGPRFVGRLPGAFAFSEMTRVCSRNGMSEFSASVLVGAHTLGQAHPPASGYQGAWDPTPFIFDSLYWQGLLNLEWHLHDITSTNAETGEVQHTQQYSLGGDNYNVSVMLFADLGQIVNTSDVCSAVNDPSNPCPAQNQNLLKAIQNWANEPSTFYSGFKKAYDVLSTWGCSGLVAVPEYNGTIHCGMNGYFHLCQKIYRQPYAFWKPDYTNAPTQAPTTAAPTPAPTPAPTTAAPATTTCAPTTTPTTAAPTTTTCAPTTTAAPTTTRHYP